MATLHCTTSSTVATVTDEEAVKQLFEEYHVSPCDYRIEDGEVHIFGYESFNVRNSDGEYCTVEFLEELQNYLDSEELVIQTVGNEKCRFPFVSCQYRVKPEGPILYSDLETDEQPYNEVFSGE